MRGSPAIFVALRSLKGRSRSAEAKAAGLGRGGMGGAVAGIALSLVPLVLVLVVSDGMIQGITNRYLETRTYHIQAALPSSFTAAEAEAGIKALAGLPGLAGAFYERSAMGLAVSGDKSGAANLRAVSPSFFSDPGTKAFLRLEKGAGSPSGRGVLVGSALAESLGLDVGSPLTIVTPGEGGGGGAYPYSPRLSFFRVAGIVSAGYRELDSLWVFVDLERGDELLRYPSSTASIGLKVAEPYSERLGAAKAEAATRLEAVYPGFSGTHAVRPWTEIELGLFRSFSTTKTLLGLVMALALLVAALNLGSALSTFVAEHTMDIAVLRSFGTSDRTLRLVFAGAGLAAGALGTLLGLTAGLALACGVNQLISGLEWAVNLVGQAVSALSGREASPVRLLDPGYYLERIPVVVDFVQILAVAGGSLALSLLSSLLPAQRAVRVSVQDLVRKT